MDLTEDFILGFGDFRLTLMYLNLERIDITEHFFVGRNVLEGLLAAG